MQIYASFSANKALRKDLFMPNDAESFLKKLDSFPELLTVSDLISLGLYSNRSVAYMARKSGQSPSYIVMPKKILYPKESVRSFILERFKDGKTPVQEINTDPINQRVEQCQ